MAAAKTLLLRAIGWAYLLSPAATNAVDRLQAALDEDGDCHGPDHCALNAVQRRASVEREDEPRSCGFNFSHCFAEPPAGGKLLDLRPGEFESLLVPAPAPNGTAQDMASLRFSLMANSVSTVLHQWQFLSDENIFAYSPAVGANLEKTAPTLSACIMAFYKPIRQVKDYFKEKIQRPRPFQTHTSVKPCMPEETSFSYPSGHATFYSATSELLVPWFRAHSQRLEYIGVSGSKARALCGVHYKSDENAGMKLGKMAAIEIMQTPQWQSFVAKPSQQVLQ
ncbi:phoN, partial [Symbiodinium pilosum]